MDATAQRAYNERGRGARRIFRTIFWVLLLVLAGFVYWRYFFTYSSGNRFGLLQKFSHKGNLVKTYEGELILSSVRSSNNVALASEKFFFSVADKRVAGQLMNLQGQEVTVHYREKKGAAFWRGDSNYIVDSVVRVRQ